MGIFTSISRRLVISLLLTCCISFGLKAQLTANAGNDTTLCEGSTVILGASPTASGGVPPYSYTWAPSTGLVNPDSANPQAIVTGNVTFVVTVTDNLNNTATATITVTADLVIVNPGAQGSLSCTSPVCTLSVTTNLGAASYIWSNGATTSFDTVNAPGTYVVTVTDPAYGCTGTAALIALQTTQPPIIEFAPMPPLSCLQNADTLTIITTDLYLRVLAWSGPDTLGGNGATLLAGTYAVTVVDTSTGCTASAVVVVIENAPHVDISPTVNNATCANNGSIQLSIYGGTAPYTCLWNNSDTGSSLSGLAAGTYSVTITDAGGCFQHATYYITQPAALVLQSASSSLGLPDTISFTPSGGSPPYTCSLDSNNIAIVCAPQLIAINATIYIETVTDNAGCMVSDTVVAGCVNECVWPGDANYDGVVDNNDLLPIGLAYDSTGYSRPNATLNYVPQYCQNWNDSLQDSINFKHIDCDGNGVINANDTMAILLNFGLTHPRSGGSLPWRSGVPALIAVPSPDTAYNGSTLSVQLTLGDSSIPASDVYGIAFTLNYDPRVVDSNQTQISFGSSWLGSSANAISIAKDFKRMGILKCALTRIDHISQGGYGAIGTAAFAINTDNINIGMYSFYNMYMFISDVTMIDNFGNILPVNAGMDTVWISNNPATDIQEYGNLNQQLRLYPNPAENLLSVSSVNFDITEIRMINTLGQMVLHQKATFHKQADLDVSSLETGIYTVQTFAEKGIATGRLVIVR